MLRFVFNNHGLSMVQGMVLSAVLAGSGLVTSRLITDQKLAQKGAETRDHIEQLHSVLYATLQNRQHCIQTFTSNAGTIPNPPAINSRYSLNNGVWVSGSGVQVFALNTGGTLDPSRTYMNGNVMITRMELVTLGDLGIPARLEIDYSRLESDGTKMTKSGYGAKRVTKVVDLVIQRIPSGQANAGLLHGCYAADSGAQTGNIDLSRNFCDNFDHTASGTNSLFFEWDDANNVCKLRNNTCSAGQVFVGIRSDGLADCRAIHDWINYGELIETNVVDDCNLASGGKVCLINTGGKVQLRCNADCP